MGGVLGYRVSVQGAYSGTESRCRGRTEAYRLRGLSLLPVGGLWGIVAPAGGGGLTIIGVAWGAGCGGLSLLPVGAG